VFAAYSVAKSAGDSQYLAEVCKDIAQSMMTSAGQSACEAQDDVLQCCDQLYINSKITENQLLYLRHLVLIRDEDVAQLYDDFQEHLSRERLLRDLFHLANTHPRLAQEGNDEDEEDDYYDDDEEEEEDDTDEQWAALQREQQRRRQQEAELIRADDPPPKMNPYSRQASKERAAARKQTEDDTKNSGRSATARTSTLNGLLSMMLRTGDVTPVEAMILNHMIASDHEIISAAYDLYQSDGDLTELQDTMMRCAKLEMRRRNEEIERQQRDIDAAGERDERRRALLQKYGDEVDEDDNGDYDEEEEEEEEEQEEEGEQEEGGLAPGGEEVLADLLDSLGVDNAWEDTVPPRFILAVFAAAQRRLLSVGQAKALCDLYQAQYDLVRAAWEVFNVQGDVVDFTDTLRRIVRDLNFRDDGNVRMSAPAKESPSAAARAKSKQDADVMAAVRQGQASSEAAKSGREDALAAVAAAKRELLKHSLEIMVKQGLVTTAAATGLYERALRGDALTDAAIDSYAADRDIMEFLDTLQILANNSPEDLDNIMRQAMAEEGEEEEEEDDEDDYDPRRASASDRENSSPSVPEEEDLDETEDMDLAQKQLRALVLKLSRDKTITKDVQTILLKLIISRDDRIMAAHDVYR
jgi:hypothetical protein